MIDGNLNDINLIRHKLLPVLQRFDCTFTVAVGSCVRKDPQAGKPKSESTYFKFLKSRLILFEV